MEPFVFIAIFIALILIVSAGVVIYQRQRNTKLASRLGVQDFKSDKSYESTVDGQKYYYEYCSGGDNEPSSFKIWINCQSKGGFKVGVETSFDRIFKRLGIAVEIQTGDSQFDSSYYINTDTVAFTRAVFNSPELRRIVNELFNHNFNEILHDGKRLQIKISPVDLNKNIDKTTIESAVKKLTAFSLALPVDYYEPRIIGTPAWKFKRGIIYTVSIISLVVGIGAEVSGNTSYPPLDKTDIFNNSLAIVVPAFFIFTVISTYLLKGRSSSHKDLLTTLGISLIGFPLFGYHGIVFQNGYHDQAPVNYHDVLVTNKRNTSSEDEDTYYLQLDSWRENHNQEEIKVTQHVYDDAKIGVTMIRLGTRPGNLGYEWVTGYLLDKVKSGQRIELETYSVLMPVGEEWQSSKGPREFINFQRKDPPMNIAVYSGYLGDHDEDTNAAIIFDSEESSMKESGTIKSYVPSGFTRSLVEIEGKKLHVMSYTITYSDPPTPLVTNYFLYIYFPSDWENSKMFYGFIIGVPQLKYVNVYDPNLTEIRSIITSIQTR